MTSSRIWDWNGNNSLWADGNEYQHIAMYGQCKGLVLDDFLYNEHSATDIRSTIYTDTQSNLETLIVLQEPITRWFKVKGNEPYYFNGYADNKLLTQAVFDDHFKTSVVKNFTDVLATADDGNGNIYNGIGYKRGVYANTNGSSIVESSFFVTTGYIPVKKGQKLVMRDLTFANAEGECRVIMFDSARKYILHVNSANFLPGNNWHIGYAGTEDGCTMTINSVVANDNVAFVRLVFYRTDVGAEPMIAVNEEIKFQYEGFLGDGIKVKGASVLLTSPSGKTFRLKVSDSGELGTE